MAKPNIKLCQNEDSFAILPVLPRAFCNVDHQIADQLKLAESQRYIHTCQQSIPMSWLELRPSSLQFFTSCVQPVNIPGIYVGMKLVIRGDTPASHVVFINAVSYLIIDADSPLATCRFWPCCWPCWKTLTPLHILSNNFQQQIALCKSVTIWFHTATSVASHQLTCIYLPKLLHHMKRPMVPHPNEVLLQIWSVSEMLRSTSLNAFRPDSWLRRPPGHLPSLAVSQRASSYTPVQQSSGNLQ